MPETANSCRIGLIGAGWMGRHHATNIAKNPRAKLVAVADVNEANLAPLRRELGPGLLTFEDHRDLLQADIDAVVIASPNASHAALCLDSAEAGKHIYCEKPMAITIEDCRRVRDAVEQTGVKYLIGYHRRLNPLYQHARGLIDSGALGRIFLAESDYIHHIPPDWDIWSWLGKEEIAGSLFHAGSGHNVDLLRFLCGDVVEVTCMKGIFLPRSDQVETEDTAIATFRFENGAIGKVHFCVGPICPFQFNLRLYGTRGTLSNNRVWLNTMPHFGDPCHEQDCTELPPAWIPDNVQGGVSETWGELMDHFVDVLTCDVASMNDAQSAYRTSRACFAAMEAAKRNSVITIGEIDR